MGYIDILLSPDAAKIEYAAGEVVKGLVRLHKKYSFIVRGVYIEFHGYESIVEHSGGNPKTRKHTIYTHKDFLFGTGKGKFALKCKISKNVRVCDFFAAKGEYLGKPLTAGSYSWPFAIQIPKDVPPSVSHPSGKASITYELNALVILIQEQDVAAHQQLIVHPGRFSSQKVVTKLEPLLSLPMFDPPRARNHKNFLFGGAPLTMECILDKACYQSGGMMSVDLFINNASSKTIHHVLVTLSQEWKVENHKENVSRKEYIYDNNFPVLPSTQYKGTVIVQLPVNIPASVNTSKWIAVNYVVQISCVIGKSPELTINLPIIITPPLAVTSPKVVIGVPIQQPMGVSASFPPPTQPMPQQSLRTTRTSFMPDQFIPVSNLQIPGPYPVPMPPPEKVQPHPPPYPPPMMSTPPPVFNPPTAPPLDSPPNNCSGWLVKKDSGLFVEKRFFVLDGRNGVLNYFVDKSMNELKGCCQRTINLRGASLFPASLDPRAPPNSFDIVNPEGVTILTAASPVEMQEWIFALSTHAKLGA